MTIPTSSLLATASSRKSLGEYKPLIRYSNGKTEVCEKSPERAPTWQGSQMIRGNRYARGTTYKTKEEAIQVAQKIIDIRREDAEARLSKAIEFCRPEHHLEYIRREIKIWQG